MSAPEKSAIDVASEALATARAAHATMQDRVGGARAALAAAAALRSALVRKAAHGDPVGASEVRKAEDATRAAEGELGILLEAADLHRAEVTAAETALAEAHREAAEARFVIARRRRCEAADAVDAAAAAFGAAVVAFNETQNELADAWRGGAGISSEQQAALQDNRQAAWTLPPAIQDAVLRSNSVRVRSLGAFQRSAFGV